MQRRSFLALLATLPFFKWLQPKPKPRTLVMGVDWARGHDFSTYEIWGTDVNGNVVHEVLEIPAGGGTCISRHAYKSVCFPYEDSGDCPISFGCNEDGSSDSA